MILPFARRHGASARGATRPLPSPHYSIAWLSVVTLASSCGGAATSDGKTTGSSETPTARATGGATSTPASGATSGVTLPSSSCADQNQTDGITVLIDGKRDAHLDAFPDDTFGSGMVSVFECRDDRVGDVQATNGEASLTIGLSGEGALLFDFGTYVDSEHVSWTLSEPTGRDHDELRSQALDIVDVDYTFTGTNELAQEAEIHVQMTVCPGWSVCTL